METDAALDRTLRAAQAALLAELAPDTHIRRVRSSVGETQVLELGTGPPLLLIHGAFGGAAGWVPIMPWLARNHRVLAVDLPGHGLADPFDFTSVDLFDLARTFLRDLLDALGLGTVDIVANSMGALFSVVSAIEMPERLPRLILVGAPLGVDRAIPFQLRVPGLPLIGRPLARWMTSHLTRDANRKFWGQVLVTHPKNVSDAILDEDIASTRRNSVSHLSLLPRLGNLRGVSRDLILGERWQALKVPTLMLWGERDAFFGGPEKGEAIARKNSNVRVVRIPDAGHIAWIDDPQRVVHEIDRSLGNITDGSLRITSSGDRPPLL